MEYQKCGTIEKVHFVDHAENMIGYVQQSAEEMEVLFTFLAERYERHSLMINQ